MTEQEKELVEVLKECLHEHNIIDNNAYIPTCADSGVHEWFAKAIIQRYPQILAEKVLDDIPNNETIKDFSSHFFSCALKSKHIQVFIREVVS